MLGGPRTPDTLKLIYALATKSWSTFPLKSTLSVSGCETPLKSTAPCVKMQLRSLPEIMEMLFSGLQGTLPGDVEVATNDSVASSFHLGN